MPPRKMNNKKNQKKDRVAARTPKRDDRPRRCREKDEVLGQIKYWSKAPLTGYLYPGSQDEYVVNRIVLAEIANWRSNYGTPTEWIALVEWMDSSPEKPGFLSWIPTRKLPRISPAFWANIDPRCQTRNGRYQTYARVYPTEAYIADALQTAAALRYPDDGFKALQWLNAHPAYPFRAPKPVYRVTRVKGTRFPGYPPLRLPESEVRPSSMQIVTNRRKEFEKGVVPEEFCYEAMDWEYAL